MNFYSTAFAPRCNFYNFTELLRIRNKYSYRFDIKDYAIGYLSNI